MIHKVGMADAKVARDGDSLRTLGLGSCVGVTLFDPVALVAGLAHVMLPSSGGKAEHPAKYADLAVPLLVGMMAEIGAARSRLVAKLAGGAQMFAASKGFDVVRVGPRNVESIQGILQGLGIPIVAQDVGGNYGRTIEVFSTTGKVSIRTAQFGETFI